MKLLKYGIIVFSIFWGIKNASATNYTQCSACEPSSSARLWAFNNISIAEGGISKTVTVVDMTNFVATTFSVKLIPISAPLYPGQRMPVSTEIPTDPSYAQYLDDIRASDQQLRIAVSQSSVPVDVIDDLWEDFIDCGSACANSLADWLNDTQWGKIEAYSLSILSFASALGIDLTAVPDTYIFELSNGGHVETTLKVGA